MIEGASVIEVDLATTLTVEPVDETKKAQLVDSLGEAGALKQGTSGPRKRPNRVDMIGPDCRAKVSSEANHRRVAQTVAAEPLE